MALGCWKPAQRAELAENGHVFCPSVRNHRILPDWYHTAFYTPGFIETSLSRRFRVPAQCPGAMGVQDAVLLVRA